MCRTTDARPVVSVPDAQGCVEMFGCGNCLGTQGRDPSTLGEFGHSVSDDAHRGNQDRIRQIQQAASKRSSAFCGPTTGEGSTSGAHDALTEPRVIEVRGGQLVRLHQSADVVSLVIGEDIAQKVVVEYDAAHVVARSGSSANEATNAA